MSHGDGGNLQFLRKFAEIWESKGSSLVSRRSLITGNNDTGDYIPPESLTPVNILSLVSTKLQIPLRIFVKFQNGPNRILKARVKLICDKNLKSKISCQTPFKWWYSSIIFILFPLPIAPLLAPVVCSVVT